MKTQSPKIIFSIMIIAIPLIVCGCTNSAQQNNKEVTVENAIDIKSEELFINGESKGNVVVSLEEKGYEHLYNPLTIQWINKDSVITNEIMLNNNNPDVWVLSINSLEKTPGGLLLELSGTHTYSLENKDFSIQIDENGISGDLE